MPTARRALAALGLVPFAGALALCSAAAAPPGEPATALAPSPSAAASARSSVLLITVDALRADRTSLYGHSRATTPNLDAFAREAAVFESFFAVSAHTSPGIVSLLTGQAPPVHAQTTQYSFYDARIPSPLRARTAEGYDTVGYANRGATYAELGFARGQDGKPSEALLAELAKSDTPFFAWLHTRETHVPYTPAREIAGRFTRGLSLDSPLLRALREHIFVLRDASVPIPVRHAGALVASEADREPLGALYDECVASADATLGAWLAAARESGLLERAIVVITADHGEELLDHGWVGHASTGYDGKLSDELLHVPLIIRLPGGRYAGRHRALASQLDLMPTLFALLGVDGSALAANQQGVSLEPVLRGLKPEVRDFVFAETTRKGWTTPREEAAQRATMLRTRERKLVVSDWGGVEFFDLRADPAEQRNLSAAGGALAAERGPFDELRSRLSDQAALHQAAALRILVAAAEAHLRELEAARERGDAPAAVARWQAIQRLHATWGLEREPAVRHDEWQALRTRVAEEAAQLIRCEARGLPLSAPSCRALR